MYLCMYVYVRFNKVDFITYQKKYFMTKPNGTYMVNSL